DARHLRDLLKDDRFPLVWIPDPTTRDLRALIKHRLRLVHIRTMVKNGLHAFALNQRLALEPPRRYGLRTGIPTGTRPRNGPIAAWPQHGIAPPQGLPEQVARQLHPGHAGADRRPD